MKYKFLLIIFTCLFTHSAHSQSEFKMRACRLGADKYGAYGEVVDRMFIKLQNIKSADEFGKEWRQIFRAHDDFKDTEYQNLRVFFEQLIQEGLMSYSNANSAKMIVEATIDFAFTEAGENFKRKELGRTKSYYTRVIYDECLK